MGDASRRKIAGMTGVPLTIMLDHLWPGTETKLLWNAGNGDVRASRCLDGLNHVFNEMGRGRISCTECSQPIKEPEDMAVCSVAQWKSEPRKVLTMPFCNSCVTSEERLSTLAKQAVKRVTNIDVSAPEMRLQ